VTDLVKHSAVALATGTAAVAADGVLTAYRTAERLPIVGGWLQRTRADLTTRGEQVIAHGIDPATALVSAVAARVVSLVLDELDLTALVRERVDVDAIAADIDIDAIVARIDLVNLANEVIDGVDLPAIIRESTSSVTADVMTDVRTQGERADDFVAGFGGPRARPWPGAALSGLDPGEAPRPAGIVSRGAAATIDLVVVAVILGALYFGLVLARLALHPAAFSLPGLGAIFSTAFGFGVSVLFLAGAWAVSGRTVGAVTMGLRVVGNRSARVAPVVAVLRAVACVVFPVGLLWVVVDKRRRSLHDIVFRTRVAYAGEPALK
jgi:uncharacterized RDD family membrane protein YckC